MNHGAPTSGRPIRHGLTASGIVLDKPKATVIHAVIPSRGNGSTCPEHGGEGPGWEGERCVPPPAQVLRRHESCFFGKLCGSG